MAGAERRRAACTARGAPDALPALTVGAGDALHELGTAKRHTYTR
jgi:hypothetical protein